MVVSSRWCCFAAWLLIAAMLHSSEASLPGGLDKADVVEEQAAENAAVHATMSMEEGIYKLSERKLVAAKAAQGKLRELRKALVASTKIKQHLYSKDNVDLEWLTQQYADAASKASKLYLKDRKLRMQIMHSKFKEDNAYSALVESEIKVSGEKAELDAAAEKKKPFEFTPEQKAALAKNGVDHEAIAKAENAVQELEAKTIEKFSLTEQQKAKLKTQGLDAAAIAQAEQGVNDKITAASPKGAPAVKAPVAGLTTAQAKSCSCTGGTGIGNKCEPGDFPWCYVKGKQSCVDGIEECTNGICRFWSETPCKHMHPSADEITAANNQKDALAAALVAPLPTANGAAAAAACTCAGGSGAGNKCEPGDFPWCYVASKDSCPDAIEESSNGVIKHWSETPCKHMHAAPADAGAFASEHHAFASSFAGASSQASMAVGEASCKCKGGTVSGNFCEPGDFPWCYLPSKASCSDSIEECNGGVCKYWSETPCQTAELGEAQGDSVMQVLDAASDADSDVAQLDSAADAPEIAAELIPVMEGKVAPSPEVTEKIEKLMDEDGATLEEKLSRESETKKELAKEKEKMASLLPLMQGAGKREAAQREAEKAVHTKMQALHAQITKAIKLQQVFDHKDKTLSRAMALLADAMEAATADAAHGKKVNTAIAKAQIAVKNAEEDFKAKEASFETLKLKYKLNDIQPDASPTAVALDTQVRNAQKSLVQFRLERRTLSKEMKEANFDLVEAERHVKEKPDSKAAKDTLKVRVKAQKAMKLKTAIAHKKYLSVLANLRQTRNNLHAAMLKASLDAAQRKGTVSAEAAKVLSLSSLGAMNAEEAAAQAHHTRNAYAHARVQIEHTAQRSARAMRMAMQTMKVAMADWAEAAEKVHNAHPNLYQIKEIDGKAKDKRAMLAKAVKDKISARKAQIEGKLKALKEKDKKDLEAWEATDPNKEVKDKAGFVHLSGHAFKMKVNSKYAAEQEQKKAEEAALEAKGCTCVGGSEYGNFCEAGSYPWCYVATDKSCADPIKECDVGGGNCKWWSEEPCAEMHGAALPVLPPWDAINAEHAVQLEAAPTAAVPGEPSCQCKGGTGEGDTCVKGDFPWCYLPGKQSCSDGIEECIGGVCQFWSETPCVHSPGFGGLFAPKSA